MNDSYTFEEILEVENLDEFSAGEVCNILALIFETGREEANKNIIQIGLDLAHSRDLLDFSDHEKMIYFYFVANGWSYCQRLTYTLNSQAFWAFETPEIENQIINLRKAVTFITKANDPEIASQVLTNLGNIFDHLGRFVEAVHYWQEALSIKNEFGMAKGNLGFGLAHYARVLFDEGHRFILSQYAFKYLSEGAQSSDVYPEAKKAFGEIAAAIEDRYGKENLVSQTELSDFSLGKSVKERNYRSWCVNNRLFLNPLNDFLYENIVSHDCLYLPSITQTRNEPPFIHTVYNQIKQEFVSARFLYYESITDGKPHFSDKGNMQMDTFDYAIYSFNTEKLKIAFRVCYSIFDKIAYVVNSYFKLGVHVKDVSFRRIWFNRSDDKKSWLINPLIENSQNWPLRGLYWIAKDLVEDKSEFSKSILPEANEIATIRNFMEHKSFKIVDFSDTQIVDNGLTYQIQRSEFETKVYKLMAMARSAIINLSFALHLEELKKEKSLSIPVPFVVMDHDYKR